jgi:hypothetical protein
MNTWPVYYYKKAKYYFLFFIPAIIAVFAPSMLINLDKELFKKYEWIFNRAPIVAMAIFMVGLIFVFIIKSIKRKSVLRIENGSLYFLNKCVNLNNANITFGKYGIPASGSLGSVLYVSEGRQELKIGIPSYTAENPNYYTKDWSMKVDCFIEKKDLETLLPAIEKKQKIETIQENTFNKNELVFELRRNMRAGKTMLLFYAFIAIPIGILLLFKITNYFASIFLIFAAIGGFIYFITQKGKKGTGFYMTIQNGQINFLHLESRKAIFSTALNSVNTDIYLIKLHGKFMNITYLTLKLRIPGFKNITIGQASDLGKNIWKDKNIKEKWFAVAPPDYVIYAENWEKLARIFSVYI